MTVLSTPFPPPPYALSLKHAQARCPALTRAITQMRTLFSEPDVDYACQGHGLAFKTEQLPGLGLEGCAPYGILLRLPDVFEADIRSLAASYIDPINVCTLDLRHNITVMSFINVEEAVIGFVMEAFYEVLELCASYEYETHSRPEVTLPILLIVGQTVVVRTVQTDKYWDMGLQATTTYSGANWRPVRFHTEEELARAEQDKQRYGLMPWDGQIWRRPAEGSKPEGVPWLMMSIAWLEAVDEFGKEHANEVGSELS